MKAKSPITFKNSGIRGSMLASGDAANPPILGFYAAQWASGVNGNMNARWRRRDGAGHGMRSSKELKGRR